MLNREKPVLHSGLRAEMNGKGQFAVVIPAYNHGRRVSEVIRESLKLNMPVFVVDDGSTDSTGAVISGMKKVRVLRHDENRGKGAAILTGFAEASSVADWVVTIDADGQHNPMDALEMIRAIPEGERPIVVGMRLGMEDEEVPWTSRFGRKFSNFWVFLSGGPAMRDSQSGFRIYPVPEAMELNVRSRRFQFEVEILVKAHWKKMRIIEAPVGVHYAKGAERISHFRPMVDFWRNTSTFSRLIVHRMARRLASAALAVKRRR